jgi:hypothetical protein
MVLDTGGIKSFNTLFITHSNTFNVTLYQSMSKRRLFRYNSKYKCNFYKSRAVVFLYVTQFNYYFLNKSHYHLLAIDHHNSKSF